MTRTATRSREMAVTRGRPIRAERAHRFSSEGPNQSMDRGGDAFDDFVRRVRVEVDAHLVGWLETKVVRSRTRGADVESVARAIQVLVARGGKRLRPALLGASYEGCGGEGGSAAVV